MKSRIIIKNIIVAISFIVIAIKGHSQDIHFSQFYNSPLSLNPALTGFMKEDVRGSAIYRSQWRQANARFLTMGVAADMNFHTKFLKADKIGAGIFFYNDQLGGGIINNNSVFVSVAYHKTMDHAKRLKVMGGLQIGFVQKTIDYSLLNFSSQIENYKMDPSINSGEDLSKNSFNYLNFNAGLGGVYQLNTKTKIFSGISFFNINNPKENFNAVANTIGKNTLKGRFTYSGTIDYRLSKKVSILPTVLLMMQTKVMDFNVGSSVGYWFKGENKTMVQAGLWYRYADAIILMSGIKYSNWNLGLSYDFTNSDLNDIKKSDEVKDNAKIGAVEISITYTGFLRRPLPDQLTIPCKFF